MGIEFQTLLQWRSEDRFAYTFKDTILYALGLGFGSDPCDENELRFVYEGKLRALPTMAIILGYPERWLSDPSTGIDSRKVLHAEQSIRFHRELPPAGAVVGRTRVVNVVDKGPGKSALIFAEREVTEEGTGAPLATLNSTIFVREQGGFGGPSGPVAPPNRIPGRAPDCSVTIPTLPQAALIYRLSGDYNPLHANPQVARAEGFARPILHGMCTYGVAARAILRAQCDYDPARVESIDARFSAPVYPGETIRTDMWREDRAIRFRSSVVERNEVVLDNGMVELRE